MNFGGPPPQHRQTVKVLVLADDDAPVRARQLPDDRIGRASVPEQSNVERVRKQVCYQIAKLLGERFIKEQPHHVTRRVY